MSRVRLKFRLERNDSGIWGTDPTDECGYEVLRSTEVSLNGSWRITDPAIRCLKASERSIGALERGDMLVTKSSGSESHVGKAALVGIAEARRRAYFSNFSQRLRPTSDLDPRYLFYLWNSRIGRAHMEISSSGSMAIRNLTGDMLGLLRIPIDSLDRQQLIADFLDRETERIDALIDAKRRLIALLAEKRTALITHAVTRGLDPSAPTKDSGIPWMREIPSHWDMGELKFLLSRIGSGKTPRGGAERYISSGVAFLRSQNVRFEGLELQDVVFIDSDTDAEMASTRVRSGDVLLNITGASLGRSCVFRLDMPANVNQHVSILRPLPGVSSDWLCFALASHPLQQQIWTTQSGSAREGISAEVAGKLQMPVPPRTEQVRIAVRVSEWISKLDALNALVQTQLHLLAEYRQALITAAVTGQLDEATLKGWQPADEALDVDVPS